MFAVYSFGNLYSLDYVITALGIRPVINLKADVTLTGSKTTTDPYKVERA